MTPPVYLSRIRLRDDAATKALLPILTGSGGRGTANTHTGHHLVWSLFADRQDRQRDFLWRETKANEFLTLSARAPNDQHALFRIDPPKLFAPKLTQGQELQFSLRANPVIRTRKGSDPSRVRKHDAVMHALKSLSATDRTANRSEVIQSAGLSWLQRQADKAGFTVDEKHITIDGYRQEVVRRKSRGSPLKYSTLDYSGVMCVEDPEKLIPAILDGFGSAKGFGCGLLLIRRR